MERASHSRIPEMKSAEHKSESLHGSLISHIFFTEALNETCNSI
jgi:hypothetical protein